MSEQGDYIKALIEACNNPDDWDKGVYARRHLGAVEAIWRVAGEVGERECSMPQMPKA